LDEAVLVTVDDVLQSTTAVFAGWVADTYSIAAASYAADFAAAGAAALAAHYSNPNSDFVQMEVTIDGVAAGKLVFELYTSVCPKTCGNFKQLCTGEAGTTEAGVVLSYAGSVIHRIQERGWVQGGDIVEQSGAAGASIYGDAFPDENFVVEHEGRGVLSMANSGLHTNASQFNISFRALPWMNKQFVAFGKLVDGSATLAALESVATASSGRPITECKIVACGNV
jgi:peptidyl-prolyl cis-trans isomerase-like 6